MMSTRLLLVSPDTTVMATAAAMMQRNMGTALIVERGHYVGVVCERDLRLAAAPGSVQLNSPTRDFMTCPGSVRLSDQYAKLVTMMARGESGVLPVVDGANMPIGMISAMDLVIAHSAYLTDVFPISDSDIISCVEIERSIEVDLASARQVA